MSLDGFMAAANMRPGAELGDGGEQLHQWGSGEDEVNSKLMQGETEREGAIICGRRTYDYSLPYWGADGPTGPARHPVFVVTHAAPLSSPDNGVYRFVTSGIESALAQARAAAGDKNVTVMGGADIAQQYLRAGLVDEILIHLVPVLFGSGLRAFEHLGAAHIQLEVLETIQTTAVTHPRYRVVK